MTTKAHPLTQAIGPNADWVVVKTGACRPTIPWASISAPIVVANEARHPTDGDGIAVNTIEKLVGARLWTLIAAPRLPVPHVDEWGPFAGTKPSYCSAQIAAGCKPTCKA